MHLNEHPPEQWAVMRTRYAYVPARLVSSSDQTAGQSLLCRDRWLMAEMPEQTDWAMESFRRVHSSFEVEEFHRRLLTSSSGTDILHGVLSVVFWGHASSAVGRFNMPFALSRANRMISGRGARGGGHLLPTPVPDIIAAVMNAREALARSQPGTALQSMMAVQFLGMSFASKVLMFIDPAKAAVYDRVVHRKLKNDPGVSRELVVDPTSGTANRKAAAYDAWCSFCADKALRLNAADYRWADWDGTDHAWRAVDVERAVFAMPT